VATSGCFATRRFETRIRVRAGHGRPVRVRDRVSGSAAEHGSGGQSRAAASCCAQQRSRSLLDATPIFAAAADPATSAGRLRAGPSRSRVIAGRSPIQTGAHGAGPPVLGRQLDGNRVIVHCDTPRKKLLPHSSRKRPLSRRVREICAGNSRYGCSDRHIARGCWLQKGRDRWPHTLHSTRSKTFSTHRARPDGSNHDHRGSGR
jgi:hypothetical protein